MKINYYFLFIVFMSLFSCVEEQRSPETIDSPEFELTKEAAALYQVVGEKHDTAMLLMRDIEKAKSELRVAKSQMGEGAPAIKEVLDLLLALKKADDGMMDWMHEFKSTELNEEEYQAMSNDEIMAYLRQEEKKIEQVHLDMIKSIEDSNLFLSRK